MRLQDRREHHITKPYYPVFFLNSIGGLLNDSTSGFIQFLFDRVINNFKWLLARFTMRCCGCEFLYLVAPHEWEAYMSVGGPMPQFAPIPDIIFKDIDNLIDGDKEDSEEGSRVLHWLYSQAVMVEE